VELRHVVGLVTVVGLAIAIGILVAIAILIGANAVLPPFVEEIDEDTAREFVPVLLAYATGVVATVTVLLVALRRFLREEPTQDPPAL
jgi:predicted lysophospholipase L1 biosynthesis ABC-type transport system permease subunit